MDNIVVQITAVDSSIPYYGTEDFKELLINKNKRPKKVLQYLHGLAHEQQATGHHPQRDLKQALDALVWEKQDSGYDVGFSFNRTKIIAFRLVGLESA